MRIWLKKDAEKKLEGRVYQRKEKLSYLADREEVRQGIRMEIDPGTGRFYIEIGWNDLLSLAPDISGDLVERVTWSETINRGFRTEGLYRHERAELVVKTEEETDYDGMDKTRTSHQVISVSGPSVDTARKIYSLVRQLKLQPEENWEVKPEKKEPPKEPATETAAPAKS